MWLAIILGIIAFLLMEHPIVFWLVFVPLGIILVLNAVGVLKGKGGAIGRIIASVIIILLLILVLLIVCIP